LSFKRTIIYYIQKANWNKTRMLPMNLSKNNILFTDSRGKMLPMILSLLKQIWFRNHEKCLTIRQYTVDAAISLVHSLKNKNNRCFPLHLKLPSYMTEILLEKGVKWNKQNKDQYLQKKAVKQFEKVPKNMINKIDKERRRSMNAASPDPVTSVSVKL
jgi:hypothetical protein